MHPGTAATNNGCSNMGNVQALQLSSTTLFSKKTQKNRPFELVQLKENYIVIYCKVVYLNRLKGTLVSINLVYTIFHA